MSSDELSEMKRDIAALKQSLAGLEWSITSHSDILESFERRLIEVESTKKTSIGYESIVNSINALTYTLSGGEVSHPQPKGESEIPVVYEDVIKIDWRITGGKEATPHDPFAYAFIYERGTTEVKPEIKPILELCKKHGSVKTADGYTIKIGGRENNLLNRITAKK